MFQMYCKFSWLQTYQHKIEIFKNYAAAKRSIMLTSIMKDVYVSRWESICNILFAFLLC